MVYKCSACGGVLVFNPELGMMKCVQCGQTSKRQYQFALKEKAPEPEEKEEVGESSFENLVYGMRKNQKWHGEEEVPVNPEWDADLKVYESAGQDEENSRSGTKDTQFMSVNIFRCTSCGAKIMIYGNEQATFCSFCGHPTVVFDKVSEEAWPDYVIPFSVSEKQAVEAIKEKFGKGLYIPDEIKNPQIDKIRGIYIPYWLYTAYIRKKANMSLNMSDDENEYKGYKMTSNIGTTRGMYPGSFSAQKQEKLHMAVESMTEMYVDAYATFERVGMDASRKLENRLAERLEPFYMEGLKEFEPSYLSGFYADRYDVSSRERAAEVYRKISAAMEKSILEDTEMNIIDRSIEQYSVDTIEYALLPAWFMTFWYRHRLYTILVNGQTGKVVGNIPVDKGRIISHTVVISTLFCMLGIFAFVAIGNLIHSGYESNMELGLRLVGFLVIVCGGYFSSRLRKFLKYRKDKGKFTSAVTTKYVKERQDKTWIR